MSDMDPGKVKKFFKEEISSATEKILKRYLQTMGEIEAIQQTLRDVAYIMFGKSGIAVDYMNHFLAGSGSAKEFELRTLLEGDDGVKTRVIGETWRRVLDCKTVSEKRQTLKNGSAMLNGLDPIITVFQKNYSNVQWWGALGTFSVRITIPTFVEGRQQFYAYIDGSDTYRWAPSEDRTSKSVHQLAQKLIDLGKAKEFPIRAKPAYVYIDRHYAKFIEALSVKQVDPHGRHGETKIFGFDPGQAIRYLEKRPLVR